MASLVQQRAMSKACIAASVAARHAQFSAAAASAHPGVVCVPPAPPPRAPPIELTYFPFEGSAEKVRLAFVLGGVEFVDRRIAFDEWPALKPKTPFGQLPLLRVGGAAPTAQSWAMLRYAGALANANGVPLCPPHDAVAVNEACGLVQDLLRDWRPAIGIALTPASYGHPAEAKGTAAHKALLKSLRGAFMATEWPRYMGYLQRRLGDGGFLCGSSPTIADCALIPVLNRFSSGQVDYVPVDCIKPFPEVEAYVGRFMALPPVKAWYNDAAHAQGH